MPPGNRKRRSRLSIDPSAKVSFRFGVTLLTVGTALFAVIVGLLSPSRPRTLAALVVPMLTLLVFAIWWLRRRSPAPETRVASVGLAFTGALGLGVIPSFPANLIALFWGLPAAMGLAFLTFAALRDRARRGRRAAVGVVFLASLAPWPWVGADGASGQMMPNLVWLHRSRAGGAARRPVEAKRPAPLRPASSSDPLASSVEEARDWAGFRGAQRDGVVHASAAAELPLDWRSRSPVETWRRAVGPGWSSFAAVGDLACTQDQAGDLERVICFDARSGRTVWVRSDRARFDEVAGGAGPRATPLIDDGRLYALGASGRLNCLDARTGTKLWSVDIAGPSGETPEWGFASSPLIHGDLVYVSPAGVGGLRMLALDRTTGERRWQAAGEASGYSSPQLAVLSGQPQILLFDGAGLVSYEPTTGERLWEQAWSSELPMAVQPHVIGDDRVLIGMGYGRGTRSFEVTRESGEWTVREHWSTARLKPKFNDFVVHEGHVFGLDEGILVCLDAATGERLWKGGRYGYGQLVLVGDVLLVVTESGELVLVEASATGHAERGRFQALDGKSWSHPAVARGRLLVRNGSEAACFDLRPQS